MHPSWPECLECKGERSQAQDFGSVPPRTPTVMEPGSPSSPRGATVIENFVDPQPIAIPIPPPPPTPPAGPHSAAWSGRTAGIDPNRHARGGKIDGSIRGFDSGCIPPRYAIRRIVRGSRRIGLPRRSRLRRGPFRPPPSPRKSDPAEELWACCSPTPWRPEGQIFPVREGRNLIGRNPECDIAIPEDPHLSDTNSHITYRKNFVLGDMVSMSGTDLNGVPVEDNFVKLPNYAQIRTGSTHFTFIIAEPPSAGKSPGQH